MTRSAYGVRIPTLSKEDRVPSVTRRREVYEVCVLAVDEAGVERGFGIRESYVYPEVEEMIREEIRAMLYRGLMMNL